MNDNNEEPVNLDSFKKNRQVHLIKDVSETTEIVASPKERIFEIHVKGKRPFEAKGALMVTPVFLAVGDQDGNFKVVVPFESLDFATCVEDFVDQVRPTDSK